MGKARYSTGRGALRYTSRNHARHSARQAHTGAVGHVVKHGLTFAAILMIVIPALADVPVGNTNGTSLAGHSPDASGVVIGITVPRREATLAATQPGRLAEVRAAEGQTVKQGDVAFSLADAGQEARTRMAAAAAASTLGIELAQARADKAARDLDWIKGLAGSDQASAREMSDALAEVEITRVQLALARFDHAQAQRAYEREQKILEQLSAAAPFTGVVVEQLKQPGETVDEREGVVRLVQLDPLIVELDCPLMLAGKVREGERFRVRPVDAQWRDRDGVVIFASPAADAASQTFRVRLAVENDDASWMSGLKVAIDFLGTTHANAYGAVPDP